MAALPLGLAAAGQADPTLGPRGLCHGVQISGLLLQGRGCFQHCSRL